MKKFLALLMAIFLIATMAVTFVGCSDNDSNDNDSNDGNDGNDNSELRGIFDVEPGVSLSFNQDSAIITLDVLELLSEVGMTEVSDLLGVRAGSTFDLTFSYELYDGIITFSFTENDVDNLIDSFIALFEEFAEAAIENAVDTLVPFIEDAVSSVDFELLTEIDFGLLIDDVVAEVEELIAEINSLESSDFVDIATELLDELEFMIAIGLSMFNEFPFFITEELDELIDTALSFIEEVDVDELAVILELVISEAVIELENFVIEFEEIATDFVENTLSEIIGLIGLFGPEFVVETVVGMIEGVLSTIDFSEIIAEVVDELQNDQELRDMLTELLTEYFNENESLVLTYDTVNGTLTDSSGFVITRR